MQDFKRQCEERAATQERINAIGNGGGLVSVIERGIREAAMAHLGQYEQYAGYFAEGKGWRLGSITRRVKTKGGLRFALGDIVLWRDYSTQELEESRRLDLGRAGCAQAFSLRGMVACQIERTDVAALATDWTVATGLVKFAGVAS